MTRWHDASCQVPSVVVESDHTPKCQNCGRSCPSVAELMSKQASKTSVLELPPDEPPGQMNLWWPKCVPYERNVDEPPQQKSSPTQQPPSPSSHSSPIYGEALKSDEFRLACLSAVPNKDAPIHVTLEVYNDDDHPEYECASYTWGGEDGDSTLCCPIYVGSYWDVLLQTKNCSSLLRFMTPWRGIRLVWVDALCINQESLVERAVQVAKMKSLYQECSRVIVYLGEDMVTDSECFPKPQSLDSLGQMHPLFPQHHPLHELHLGPTEILSQRYFSRLWVIQELIVSQQAMIRIGDVDFRANAGVMARPSSNNKWSSSPAPWIQLLAHGSIPVTGVTDIVNVLRLTAQSRSTDPRDRLFGVISLLSDSTIRLHLAPNYTLSYQQFCVGFFAYLFLVGGEHWFLWHAGVVADLRSKTEISMPSWIPNCRLDTSWQSVMTIASAVNRPQKIPALGQEKAFRPSEPFALYRDQACKIRIRRIPMHDHLRDQSRSVDDTVDAATGALLINATHVLSLRDGLITRKTHGPLHLYTFWKRTANGGLEPSSLTLVSMGPLEFQPENDHIFIPEAIVDTVLILRQKQGKAGLQCFELMTSRVRLFEDSQLQDPDSFLGALQKGENHNNAKWSKVGAISDSRYDVLKEIQASVASALVNLQRYARGWTHDEERYSLTRLYRSFRYFFFPMSGPNIPSMQGIDALLRKMVLLCLLLDQERRLPIGVVSLRDAIIDCIDSRFQPNVVPGATRDEDYITLAISIHEWYSHFQRDFSESALYRKSLGDFYRGDNSYRCWWEYKYPQNEGWRDGCDYTIINPSGFSGTRHLLMKAGIWVPEKQIEKQILIRASFPLFLDQLRRQLGDVPVDLKQVTEAYDESLHIDAIVEMIKHGPTEEQKRMGSAKYIGGVKIDGTISRIRIE